MRYNHALLALILAASPTAAQSPERESAIGTQLSGYGGFIGLDTRFGDMMDEFAVFMGAHAAVLLKHRVYLGLSGAALVSDDGRASGRPLDMGYGGLLVGYVVPTPGLVQLTIDALIGAGGVRLADQIVADDEDWDALFVFDPSLGAEIRLARIARLGLGIGYRFIGAVDTPGLTDSDLRGITGTATVRLGWF